MNNFVFFDTHTHYDWKEFNNDRDVILNKLATNTIIVNIGCNIESCKLSLLLTNTYNNIYTSLGIHPMNVCNGELIKDLEQLFDKKVVAVGETGLDANFPNLDLQRKYFLSHIELANKYNLPIVIHCRKMHAELYDILKNNIVNKKGIMHCYSGPLEYVNKFLELGYYFGFDGPITRSEKFDEIIKQIPLNKIVVETDAPLMSPLPFDKAQRSDSTMLHYITEKISKIKNVNYAVARKQIFINSLKIYNLDIDNLF